MARLVVRDQIHEKGRGEENEDALVIAPDLGRFAVLDGATALGDGALPGFIAARTLCAALADPETRGWPLVDAVIHANRVLGRAAREHGGPDKAEELPRDRRSSCGLAAVQLDAAAAGQPARMNYVQAGDCMLFTRYRDGTVRALTHDHLSALDQEALGIASDEADQILRGRDPSALAPAELVDLRKAVMDRIAPVLRQNRARMNTPEGYGSLDGSIEAEGFLETGSLLLGQIDSVLLLTDGFHLQARGASSAGSWLDAAAMAFRDGLQTLHRHVAELERSDPACYHLPRFKTSDDRTGILLSVER